MGQDVDQTLRELDATRAGLERDLDELFARLPEPAVIASRVKTYGAAAGGAAATVGLVVARQRKKSALRARRMEARVNAEELARAFSPHPPVDPSGRSRAGLLTALAAVAIGAVVALRMRGGDND